MREYGYIYYKHSYPHKTIESIVYNYKLLSCMLKMSKSDSADIY